MILATITGLLGTLIGLFLGNRLALDRDKRKEFNASVAPLRAALISADAAISNVEPSLKITEKQIIALQATIETRRLKKIINAYNCYKQSVFEAGKWTPYGQFTWAEGGEVKLRVSIQSLLKTLELK